MMFRNLGEGEGFGIHISYTDLYGAIVFVAAMYASRFCSSKILKTPALVGEIFAGIVMGPSLIDMVPNPEAFVMLGEVG